MPFNNFQQAVLQAVIQQYEQPADAVAKLAAALHISKESVRRRIKGDTALTAEELFLLAKVFKISLDHLIQPTGETISFSYNEYPKRLVRFETYIDRVYENLLEASSLKEVVLYYTSQEIPVFSYFYFPELVSFKLYVFGLTVWNFETLRDQSFHRELIPPGVREKAAQCARVYAMIDSKDLWSPTVIDQTLNQIRYIASTNRFAVPGDALLLCQQLDELLDRTQRMAELGKKFFANPEATEGYADFDMFFNELINTNNTILVKSPERNILFSTLAPPNFLMTDDALFCHYMDDWFQTTLSRSTSISRHSEKDRILFFNKLRRKIDETRDFLRRLR